MLARPYWFTHERSTISIGSLVFTIKESWIGRAVLAMIVFLSVFLVFISKLINDWNARFVDRAPSNAGPSARRFFMSDLRLSVRWFRLRSPSFPVVEGCRWRGRSLQQSGWRLSVYVPGH